MSLTDKHNTTKMPKKYDNEQTSVENQVQLLSMLSRPGQYQTMKNQQIFIHTFYCTGKKNGSKLNANLNLTFKPLLIREADIPVRQGLPASPGATYSINIYLYLCEHLPTPEYIFIIPPDRCYLCYHKHHSFNPVIKSLLSSVQQRFVHICRYIWTKTLMKITRLDMLPKSPRVVLKWSMAEVTLHC